MVPEFPSGYTADMLKRLPPLLIPSAIFAFLASSSGYCEDAPTPNHFVQNVQPFLVTHCVACHGADDAEGGVNLERFEDSANVQKEYELWEKIARLVNEHQMPPPDEEQPTSDEVIAFAAAIDTELASFDCSADKHPGRVTIRRLNKAEYNNTIRDLIGLDLRLADDFPSDDVGNGFDNIADVLSIPPVLMEKYLAAAVTAAESLYDNEEARKRAFPHQPNSDDERVESARKNIREFATRAFRRPITSEEEERLFEIMVAAFKQDANEAEIFETVTAAVLSSPHFLFRVEKEVDAKDNDGIRELNDYELASRLSYFLWSSMPDQRLFDLASRGELRNRDVLATEASRMLADPRARAIVDNFAGQWLQLRDVSRLTPDPDKFPAFDDELRVAMRRETETFFESMIREDRSVLEFLNADFTYVNERLARHYGIENITGDEFQRVSLSGGRRGVLTHAGILMLTSNPTRTSPVKRGKWILDNMLAQSPPPPPPNVPVLEEGAETLGSLREQMEQHRSNPSCAVCHQTMDALGFGLEKFDAVGAYREMDGRFEIDASGELPGGKAFAGSAELMEILSDDMKHEFSVCLTKKLLTYALGRGLVSYDRCTINDTVAKLRENNYRFSSLVSSIVTSDPFTMREAKREE